MAPGQGTQLLGPGTGQQRHDHVSAHRQTRRLVQHGVGPQGFRRAADLPGRGLAEQHDYIALHLDMLTALEPLASYDDDGRNVLSEIRGGHTTQRPRSRGTPPFRTTPPDVSLPAYLAGRVPAPAAGR